MQREEYLDGAAQVETAIASLGGTGKGLHTKIDSISNILDESLEKQLRYIASVRNKAAHEAEAIDEQFNIKNQNYLSACEECVKKLKEVAKNVNTEAMRQALAKRMASDIKKQAENIETLLDNKLDDAIKRVMTEFLEEKKLKLADQISESVEGDIKKLLESESLNVGDIDVTQNITIDPIKMLNEIESFLTQIERKESEIERLEEKAKLKPIEESPLGYAKGVGIMIKTLLSGRSLEDVGNEYLVGRSSKYDDQIQYLEFEIEELIKKGDRIILLLNEFAPGFFEKA